MTSVSFALSDFSEKYPITLPENLLAMETSGIKGSRKEMMWEELHTILCSRYKFSEIHLELLKTLKRSMMGLLLKYPAASTTAM